jgi:hypothetical protein
MHQREERRVGRVGREGGIERYREREAGREKSARAGSEGAREGESARERTHQPCSTFVASPHKGYERTR